MSLFANPAEHAANPPDTWKVTRVGRRYALQTEGGIQLDSFERKRDAESARTSGFIARLYADEARWYAGEQVPGWRPYKEVVNRQR